MSPKSKINEPRLAAKIACPLNYVYRNDEVSKTQANSWSPIVILVALICRSLATNSNLLQFSSRNTSLA
jgi:hypothetical protein